MIYPASSVKFTVYYHLLQVDVTSILISNVSEDLNSKVRKASHCYTIGIPTVRAQLGWTTSAKGELGIGVHLLCPPGVTCNAKAFSATPPMHESLHSSKKFPSPSRGKHMFNNCNITQHIRWHRPQPVASQSQLARRKCRLDR